MLFMILLGVIGLAGGLYILFSGQALLGICLTLLFATLGIEIGATIDAAIVDSKLRKMNKKTQ